MMAFRDLVAVMAISAGFALLPPRAATAFELNGAWATSAERCTKVFVRKGRANQIGFRNFSGMHGSGFIAEADRLKGKSKSCQIKSKKQSGKTINLVVACASGVMLANVQFFLNEIDENTIAREFPGMEGMEVRYYRCRL